MLELFKRSTRILTKKFEKHLLSSLGSLQILQGPWKLDNVFGSSRCLDRQNLYPTLVVSDVYIIIINIEGLTNMIEKGIAVFNYAE